MQKNHSVLAPNASQKTSRPGFTLIELIVVIAIIAIIAATIFIAIDPAKRLHVARNSRRWSNVAEIAKALKTYEADNASLPASIDSSSGSVQVVGESLGACAGVLCTGQTVIGSNCAVSDLDTVLRAYWKKPPVDPSTGSDNDTRYYVNKDAYGIITVGSCDAEGEGLGGTGTAPTIEVTQ
ncbi:MAG: prepilin-type N-terminal cleavage/methylation domain-containing protein [Candidatus Peribacteraceae bacterium]|nr:prepilin-type N-terminal cleavage/methylation domain-containing protein [Candidatus Peribacteraceae bacterium]MDD5074546.1 prepilin-type N-terminal cleavage/methylation domain-containing protein [Candidatus Peribacteraceae bacterium]